MPAVWLTSCIRVICDKSIIAQLVCIKLRRCTYLLAELCMHNSQTSVNIFRNTEVWCWVLDVSCCTLCGELRAFNFSFRAVACLLTSVAIHSFLFVRLTSSLWRSRYFHNFWFPEKHAFTHTHKYRESHILLMWRELDFNKFCSDFN
jgi:hypothetical protein